MPDRRPKQFYGSIAAIVFLIVFGVAFILKSYSDYVDRFIQIQDSKQLQLAQSVDRNIQSLLEQSANSLEYITGLDSFRLAEEQWFQQGGSGQLLNLLIENHLNQNELISSVTVLEKGRFPADDHGYSAFDFLNEDVDSSRRICLGANGSVYLAIICQGRGDISYASMIDLQRLYQKISSSDLVQSDHLILLDQNRSVLLHFCTDSQSVKNTLVENCPKREDFRLLLAAEEAGEQACFPFVYQTQKMDKGYNAHIMVLPSGSSENNSFAIGLVSNVDEALLPLRSASLRWLLGGISILLGISLLLFLLLYYKRRNEEGIRELEILREKNLYMEELNRKTQEMAHHQRLETIGTLTSGIAHEFNNLLTPIMGYSMMTLEQLSADQEELYDNVLEIYHSSRKAKEITAQLSQLARKNNSEEKKLLDMEQLIDTVLHVALPACPPGVSTERSSSLEGKCRVYGNETQLSQLFLNLMINAFHAMENSGGLLSIRFRTQQDTMLIQVQDSGCGIPEAALPHLFEPFFTTKEGGKGSGLGLAIAHQIVEDHHGSIEVQSKEGEGSCFTVRLPLYYN